MNQDFLITWQRYFEKIIAPSIFATIRMVIGTMIIGFILGFILSILLTLYKKDGLNPKPKIYSILNFLVNTVRSFPLLILIVAISPLTRIIMGTTIGEKAAVLPLSIACTMFIARMLEDCFRNVDKQLIEAAKSFGASNMQIIFKVIVKESVPSVISVLTISTITYIGATTIAGAVGAGGLGSIALNYGYQSFNNFILYTCVFILFILVQLTQLLGNWLYKKSL